MTTKKKVFKSDWFHTHSQYRDRDSDEPPCKPDLHHWIETYDAEEDHREAVCSRCGEVVSDKITGEITVEKRS